MNDGAAYGQHYKGSHFCCRSHAKSAFPYRLASPLREKQRGRSRELRTRAVPAAKVGWGHTGVRLSEPLVSQDISASIYTNRIKALTHLRCF